MSISRLLNEAAIKLKYAGIEDPAFEAGLILSWVIKKPLSYVYAHSDRGVGATEAARFKELVTRRAMGEPFQYITGECEFLSLPFKVNPGVLIPRRDTELLAEAALFSLGCSVPFGDMDLFRITTQGRRNILDIGTGSGCLAVSIAHYASNVWVDALDISEEALATAGSNAEQNGVQASIHFIQANFLTDCRFAEEPYDLVVSNPPYIPRDDKTGLMPSVEKYEPEWALFADGGGLCFYNRLAEISPKILAENGVILVECGFNQSTQVQSIFQDHNMETRAIRDLSGIERVIAARFHV